MAEKVLVSKSLLNGIGDAIRTKRSKTTPIPLAEMAAEIRSIEGGGSTAVINPLAVNGNGQYNAPAGVDGFNPVVVEVPTYRILSRSFEENGTFAANPGTAFGTVIVNVPINAVHGLVVPSGVGTYRVECGFRPKHISLIQDINNGASGHHSTYDEDSGNIREAGTKYTIPGNDTSTRLKSIDDTGFSFYIGSNTNVGVWYLACGEGIPSGSYLKV